MTLCAAKDSCHVPEIPLPFERFILGLHKHMGDVVRPDWALSLDVLHGIMWRLELKWAYANDGAKFALAQEASFYLIAYCGTLRVKKCNCWLLLV